VKICGIPVVFDASCDRVAVARGVWPFKKIAVGPSLNLLSERERFAVLYHEAAHCKRFHMEARILLLPLLLLSRIVRYFTHRHEFSADRFAAEHGWGVDLATWLMRVNQPESDFYPSCAERVRALKGERP
jgi:Zn-dependent protease with chaperone function